MVNPAALHEMGCMSDQTPSSRPEPPQRKGRGDAQEWSRLSQLVFEFLGYLAALGYAGWALDQRYGWNGHGLFGGLMVGLAAWIYRVLRVYRNLFK